MDVFDLVAKITLDSSEYESALKGAGESTKGFGAKMGGAFKALGGAALAGLATAATGVVAIGKSAFSAYADYEQLVGGVETLFSNLDGTVSASSIVLENAANAYKTAGMSANAYMETVTSFSAALVSSLNNDYKKAANVSDMAIKDMSDNANKMGTSMDLIQNAYQGFAKQNYTMLDNLKLGYGGTKTEMERLLADAEKFSGVHYDIDNLADVYEAIHVVQEELGIAGTTAEEASETISGSTAAMKAAWENLVVGIADGNADLDTLLDNFIESVGTAADNIIPRISTIVDGFSKLVSKIGEKAPEILSSLVQAISDNLPTLGRAGLDIILGLGKAIAENLGELVDAAVETIIEFAGYLADNAGDVASGAVEILVALAEALITNIPELLKAVPEIAMRLAESLINELREALGPVGEFLFGKVDETGQGASDRAGYWGGQIYDGFGGKSSGGSGRAGEGGTGWGVVEDVDSTGDSAVTRAQYWGNGIYAAFHGFGGQAGGGAGRDGSNETESWGVVEEVDEAGQAAVEAAGEYNVEIHAAFEGGGGKTSGGGAGRGGGGMSADFYATVEQAAEGAREAAIEGGGWVSEDFVTTVASGVAQKGSVVPDAATAVMDSTKTAVEFAISGMGTSGELIPDNIAGGVTSGASTLYQSVTAAMEQANAEAAASAVQAQMAGQAFDTSTAGGIRGSAGTVSGAARGTVTGAISSARGATGGARSVGVSIGTGMESGILSVAKRIASAAARVVSMALEAAKARADSHSPSRVFRDEVGKMLTLGIAEGMVSKDVLNALDKSAAELTGDTVKDLETMTKAWDAVYKNYYEGLEHQNFFLELAGDTDGIIANYRKMQETLHEQKEHYLRMGVDANDSAIRDMEEQWWDYQDKIDGVYDGIAKKAEQTYDTMIDVMEHKLFLSEKQGKSPEERLAILEELMEETHKRAEALRAQGYTDDSKEIRDLQKQWWGYHDDVEDINEDIAKSVKERNDKIADAMKKSVSETADIFTELAEAAQKAYDEAFDAIMDKQKAMQDKLAGYGELYKSTTTTSGKTYVSLQDLDRQTKQLERYGEIIEELRSRGVSGNLMEDILGMGIDEGSEFGKRLLNMSEGGLNDYLASYQRKQDIAADIASRYYKPEFDALNGQNTEMTIAQQQNLEYSEEQVSLLRRIAESFEGSAGQTVQVVVDGQVIANATFDDLVMVGKQRGRDIVNVKEG